MGLEFIAGGTAACSLLAISNAMRAGKGRCLAAQDDFPPNWRSVLGNGQITIGYDPATTEKQKSNPSGLTIMEKVGGAYAARLLMRFKTADDDKALALLDEAVDIGEGRRPRRLVIDATNERYFAQRVRKHFLGRVPVDLVVSSESFPMQEMSYKTFLGNQLVNVLDDNMILLPEERWIRNDWRLVYKDRGLFQTHVDKSGNHGDTFDSTKLALHGFFTGGPVEAEAAGSAPVDTLPWRHSSTILA